MCFVSVFCMIVTTSCSVKTGIYNLDNFDQPLGIKEEPFKYLEWEAYTPRIIKDHVDVVFGIGMNDGKSEGEINVAHDYGGYWMPGGDIPEVSTNMWEFRLGTRFFPLGVENQNVVPYVGGGVGYFYYDMNTSKRGDFVGSDWFYNYYEIDKDSVTLAEGSFPYLSVGLYLRLSDQSQIPLQMEFRYDFDKVYKKHDMSGYQVTIGLAFLW